MKQKITLQIRKSAFSNELESRTIKADVVDGYAVHHSIHAGPTPISPYWTVTHIKSGFSCGSFHESAAQAKTFRKKLASIQIDGRPFADFDTRDALKYISVVAAQIAEMNGQDPTEEAEKARKVARETEKVFCK